MNQLGENMQDMPQVEAEIKSTLSEQDAVRDQKFDKYAPVGNFSAQKVNTLCRLANDVYKLLGAPYEVAMVTKDIERGPLPTDLFKALVVIRHMAEKYMASGGEVEPFDVATVTDDQGLMPIIMSVSQLLTDKAFKAFLKQPMEEELSEAPVAPVAPGKAPLVPGSNPDLAFLS
jgi:hypothetical protein